jgi:hypothetical protein
VFAPSKRRRVSYYLSLPVVITVVFLLVARLVAVQRAEIIAELSDRVAHHGPEDASDAVRQLGEMPRPPAAVLVAAATGGDRQVADEAKQAIARQLCRAQQKLEAGRGMKSVARQLAELARELADHRHAFSATDQPWLVTTTQRIVSLANQVPAKHVPLVAANCDLILTSIPHGATAAEPGGVQASSTLTPPSADNAMRSETTPTNGAADSEESADAVLIDSMIAPWRTERSEPRFRELPRSPAGTNALRPSASPLPQDEAPPELPAEADILGRPMAEADTRSLLQKWQETKGQGLTPSEQQLLKKRGFDRLPAPLVEKLLSDQRGRLELVDDVLQETGINARPWLILLAGDADAVVRLAAVTVMATSSDAALVEHAWQTAIHDRDPRVAALANRLKERRATIQRR